MEGHCQYVFVFGDNCQYHYSVKTHKVTTTFTFTKNVFTNHRLNTINSNAGPLCKEMFPRVNGKKKERKKRIASLIPPT